MNLFCYSLKIIKKIMNDKLLYEFASKLNRSKNQYESTKKQCDLLKKEAIKLEKANI